jgi:hypothetical protein
VRRSPGVAGGRCVIRPDAASGDVKAGVRR